MKRRVELLDDYGNHVTTVDAPAHTEGFEGADFSGLCAPGLKGSLRFKNLRGANLYWAMLQGTDSSGCNLEGADLRGANLRDALLVGANLRNAEEHRWVQKDAQSRASHSGAIPLMSLRRLRMHQVAPLRPLGGLRQS